MDRFGNLITNLVAMHGGTIEIAGRAIPLKRAYADVAVGEITALVGSLGFVELSVRDGSAARTLGVERGEPVLLHPAPPLRLSSPGA